MIHDIHKINKIKSPNVFVKSYKTNNLYEVDKTIYNKVICQCQKSHSITEYQTNTDQLQIDDRVEVIALKQAYITLNDYKYHCPNNMKCLFEMKKEIT